MSFRQAHASLKNFPCGQIRVVQKQVQRGKKQQLCVNRYADAKSQQNKVENQKCAAVDKIRTDSGGKESNDLQESRNELQKQNFVLVFAESQEKIGKNGLLTKLKLDVDTDEAILIDSRESADKEREEKGESSSGDPASGWQSIIDDDVQCCEENEIKNDAAHSQKEMTQEGISPLCFEFGPQGVGSYRGDGGVGVNPLTLRCFFLPGIVVQCHSKLLRCAGDVLLKVQRNQQGRQMCRNRADLESA